MTSPPDLPFGHSGDFASWEEAFQASAGYRPAFEQRVCQATIALLEGRANYTRDGSAYEMIEYFWPTLRGAKCWILDRRSGVLGR